MSSAHTGMAFHKVAALDEIRSGEMRGFEIVGRKILLVNHAGTVFAYEDRCPHLGVRLSAGSLEGEVLTCFAHQWKYSVCNGTGIKPTSKSLCAFPVKIEDDSIYVDLET